MSLEFMRVPFGAEPALFADRVDAGRRLGHALKRFSGERPLVLGIPRGGVPVAAEVARALDGDLDVIVARTLRAPGSPQLVVGAVTADGACYLNQEVVDHLDVPDEHLDAETRTKRAEADQNERRLRIGTTPPPVANRTVIIVDDGVATGSTMIAAARSVRARRPQKLVIAVPVAPRATCDAMRAEADDVICLDVPDSFIAIALHYRDFAITEDEDVARILGSRRPKAAATAR
jgi:putative phosphoribosyl transferase